jgi:hypothetical protein
LLETMLRKPWQGPGHALADALARASASIARLDQALSLHPLQTAFLYRTRLEAARRQAAVDGLAIDPWHLAAVLEGFRLRMDHALRIIDRGSIFEAARHALTLHQWMVEPDFDQEGEVRRAEGVILDQGEATPLLAAAFGMRAWLEKGEDRAPIRAAVIRHWKRQRLLRSPVPLTGAASLRRGVPWDEATWVPAFLSALAGEADDGLHQLFDMERAWLTARRAVAGKRRNSRAAAAVDILAAAPLVSGTSLAAALGMAPNNATALLDQFCAAGIAVEVTHRSKRRLFGLSALAPLRDEVAPPRRPEPGRGRGRPPMARVEEQVAEPLPMPPMTPIQRREFDTGDHDHWMAQVEQKIQQTRRVLESTTRPKPED